MTLQVVIQQYSTVRHQQRCCALSECSRRSPAHSSAPQTQSTMWSHVSSTPHTPATSKLGSQQSSATLRGGWDPNTVHVFLEIPQSLVNLKKNLRLACRFHTPSSQRRKLCLPPTPCYPSRMPHGFRQASGCPRQPLVEISSWSSCLYPATSRSVPGHRLHDAPHSSSETSFLRSANCWVANGNPLH